MRYGMMAAAVGLALSGTAAAQSLVKGVPPEQVGYLLATIGMVAIENPRISVGISLCNQDKREIAVIRYLTSQTAARKLDFRDGAFAGAVVSVALPAGSYFLCDTELYNLDRRYVPKGDKPAIPLTIQAGKANYIGRYQLAPEFVENFLGHQQFRNARWLISNKWTEDGRAFIEQAPYAATLPPVLAMPTTQQLPRPLFNIEN